MLSRACTTLAALSLLLPAVALADTGKSVTSTGAGRVPVMPTNRKDDASIRAAVEAARKQAIPSALADARDHAAAYAAAAGLTLGPVQSVSDAAAGNFPPFAFPTGPIPFPISVGPGGIENYCGLARQPIFRTVGNHRRVVRVITHRACYVPAFASVTLTVTYTAT